MSAFDLSVLFFLQLAVILCVCRLVGWVGARFGQPQVVGEMIAGVVLGPSIFGLLAPDLQASLFPKESKVILFAVCQVGLSIYMFLIGLEFDFSLIHTRLRSAFSVSLSGILVPFALGAGAAWLLKDHWPLFSEKTTRIEAALFLGAAMSITAFPMLARIIYERGLTGTSLGTLALAAGSIDDAAAWCVLAVVLASFKNDPNIAMMAIGGGLAYVAFVAFLAKPLLKNFARLTEKAGTVTPPILGFTLAIVMLGAWFTDYIGIYAVFGAFILGLGMPRGLFAAEIKRQVEPMTTCFLLPLFFVYSGLNTQIKLLNDPNLIGITILLIVLAILGKGVACWLAALLNGESNREAMAIGTLMNARGLMELIILNIGLQYGVITPTLFTIMVLMAIITTLMASPLFEVIYGRHRQKTAPGAESAPA